MADEKTQKGSSEKKEEKTFSVKKATPTPKVEPAPAGVGGAFKFVRGVRVRVEEPTKGG